MAESTMVGGCVPLLLEIGWIRELMWVGWITWRPSMAELRCVQIYRFTISNSLKYVAES